MLDLYNARNPPTAVIFVIDIFVTLKTWTHSWRQVNICDVCIKKRGGGKKGMKVKYTFDSLYSVAFYAHNRIKSRQTSLVEPVFLRVFTLQLGNLV